MIENVTDSTAPSPNDPSRESAPPKWTFVRSADGGIGGVCQSVSVATGTDVSLVRLSMIGAALWGPGLLLYLALVLAVPRADSANDPRVRRAPEETARWMRIAMAVGGITGAASVIGGIGWGGWPVGSFYRDGGGFGLMLLAIAIGVILVRRNQNPRPGADHVYQHAPAAPAPQPAATPAGPMSATAMSATAMSATAIPATAVPATPAPTEAPGSGTETDADSNRAALLITRITGWLIVLGALGIALGLIAALRLEILDLRLPGLMWTLAAVALVGAGVALIATRSIGVIAAALGALMVVWLLGALATSWSGPVGTRTIVVSDITELVERYEHAAGRLTLDLSALPVAGATRVEVDNRAGVIDVVVPDDVAIDVSSHVSMGESHLLGQRSDGWSVSDRVRDTPPGATATLTIDLDMGVGSARVCRAVDAYGSRRCPS